MAPKSSERDDLLWELNDRIEDLRHFKRDQWQFAYAAIGAEAAILLVVLAKSEDLLVFHRALVSVAALGIWLLWRVAHSSSWRSMNLAREEIQAMRTALGGRFENRPAPPTLESPKKRKQRLGAVHRAISLATIGAMALTLIAAWGAGTRWAGFSPQSDPSVGMRSRADADWIVNGIVQRECRLTCP